MTCPEGGLLRGATYRTRLGIDQHVHNRSIQIHSYTPDPPVQAHVDHLAAVTRTCNIGSLAGTDSGLRCILDRKSTRLNSSHSQISYAVFCLKKKKKKNRTTNQK